MLCSKQVIVLLTVAFAQLYTVVCTFLTGSNSAIGYMSPSQVFFRIRAEDG